MSRGKPKPKLRDLSVSPLTQEEQDALLDAVAAATSPVATAVLGAVLVEHELEAILRKKFRISDDKDWEEFVEESGFLSNFSRKIMVGHALRLYDGAIRDNLDIVRVIRNGFAHSKRLIDFDHPLVSRELKKIKIPKKQSKSFRAIAALAPNKDAYICLCYRLVSVMIHSRAVALRRSAKRRERKYATSPLYRALAPALGLGDLSGLNTIPVLGLAALGSNPQSLLPGQSVGPKTGVPIGSPAALLHSLAKNADKKDK
jgi:hypothetical protein